MHREVTTGDKNLATMKAGLVEVANLVKRTMGVRGKNVVLDTIP